LGKFFKKRKRKEMTHKQRKIRMMLQRIMAPHFLLCCFTKRLRGMGPILKAKHAHGITSMPAAVIRCSQLMLCGRLPTKINTTRHMGM
jgi:hypothetical protein